MLCAGKRMDPVTQTAAATVVDEPAVPETEDCFDDDDGLQQAIRQPSATCRQAKSQDYCSSHAALARLCFSGLPHFERVCVAESSGKCFPGTARGAGSQLQISHFDPPRGYKTHTARRGLPRQRWCACAHHHGERRFLGIGNRR